MKDQEARSALKDLVKYLGLEYYPSTHEFSWTELNKGYYFHKSRIKTLEAEIAAMKEEKKPTCQTCGQKIQDGFHAGDVETLAAGVRKTDKSRK